MMSPLIFTSTCSMTSARIGVTADAATRIAATKSCFVIIFNILAYPDAFAQIPQQAGYPAEDAPLGPRIFLGRPENFVLRETGRHFPAGRPSRPPGPRMRCAGAARCGRGPRRFQDPHVEPKCGWWSELEVLPLLNDLEQPRRVQLRLGPEL